jgi:hypothetical protein
MAYLWTRADRVQDMPAGGRINHRPYNNMVAGPDGGAVVEKVRLGSQGAVVSRMGLGCMGMSEFYGQTDDAESAATILRSLDLGMTVLDTADMYGSGHNEELP